MARMSHRNSSGKLIVWIALIALCVAGVAGYRSYPKRTGMPAKPGYSSVVIDLKSGYRVCPALARIKQDETFGGMVSRLKPYAAITGTYYGVDHRPVGDIVIDGKIVCRGGQRQGIGFTRSGGIRFFERKGSSRISWKGCIAGVACGPRLITGGKIDINVRRDGFRSGAATLEARRCAAGATRDGKLVLLAVSESITLRKLAQAMQELGAVDAINLDGGGLCAFYLDGECYSEPVLPVSNIIAVYKVKS